MRDITLEDTFKFDFTTRAFATGIPTALAGTPVLKVHEEGNDTFITAGVTVDVSVGSTPVVGLNEGAVVATAANGYENGKSYAVFISTGTVGGVSVVGEVVERFTIGASAAAVDLANATDGLGALKAVLDAVAADVVNIDGAAMRGTDGANTTVPDAAGTAPTVSEITTELNANLALSATALDLILKTSTFALAMADANWDEVLTGATHNVAASAGRRLRQLTGIVYTDGTAQAGGTNTITLSSGESATDDIFEQAYISIVGGTGAGQGHHILAYNGTTKVAVLDDDWITTPDATSEYVVFGSGSHDETATGLAQAGAASTITLKSSASSTDDIYNNNIINIASGTGVGQTRRITAYNGTTKVATVSQSWVTNPDATSGYMIYVSSEASVDELAATVTSAQLVDDIWDELASDHTTAGSFGKIIKNITDIVQLDGTISDAGPITTDFDTTLTGYGDGYFNDALLIFTDAAANKGLGLPITGYTSATGNFQFAAPDDWPVTPVNSDPFVIYALHVHPISQIQSGLATTAELDKVPKSDGAVSWNATAIAAINAEIVDVLKTDVIVEMAQGAPPTTPTFEEALMYQYMALVRGGTSAAASKEFKNNAGTVIWKKVLSDDTTTYTEADGVTGP